MIPRELDPAAVFRSLFGTECTLDEQADVRERSKQSGKELQTVRS